MLCVVVHVSAAVELATRHPRDTHVYETCLSTVGLNWSVPWACTADMLLREMHILGNSERVIEMYSNFQSYGVFLLQFPDTSPHKAAPHKPDPYECGCREWLLFISLFSRAHLTMSGRLTPVCLGDPNLWMFFRHALSLRKERESCLLNGDVSVPNTSWKINLTSRARRKGKFGEEGRSEVKM